MHTKITFLLFLFASFCAGCGGKTIHRENTQRAVPPSIDVARKDTPVSDPRKRPEPSAVAAPAILSRQDWRANEPKAGLKPHQPSKITIHHTASPQSSSHTLEEKLRNLQTFSQHSEKLSSGHLKPEWPDVPYHYYIDLRGQIAEGREVQYVGDTNTEYDPTGHLLIVLEGNFEKEEPSPQQLQSLEQLAAWLALRWKIPVSQIKMHKDYAATVCPGKNLEREMPGLLKNIAEHLGSLPKP